MWLAVSPWLQRKWNPGLSFLDGYKWCYSVSFSLQGGKSSSLTERELQPWKKIQNHQHFAPQNEICLFSHPNLLGHVNILAFACLPAGNQTLPLYFWKVLSSLRGAQHRLLCFFRTTFSPRTCLSFVFKQFLSILNSSFNMLYPILCLAFFGKCKFAMSESAWMITAQANTGWCLTPCPASLHFLL